MCNGTVLFSLTWKVPQPHARVGVQSNRCLRGVTGSFAFNRFASSNRGESDCVLYCKSNHLFQFHLSVCGIGMILAHTCATHDICTPEITSNLPYIRSYGPVVTSAFEALAEQHKFTSQDDPCVTALHNTSFWLTI